MTDQPSFRWRLDDLEVSVRAPSSGQAWCLDVDVTRPSTGEAEAALWDAGSPSMLVRRDARSPAAALAAPSSHGGDLLITSEQGIGDIVQEWRYVAAMVGRFRQVRVECRPELRRLFQQQGLPVVLVTPDEARTDPAGTRASLMRLGTGRADPTGGGAYLTVRHPSAQPGACGGRRPRIGLNWAANARALGRDTKAMPFHLLERIVRTRPDAAWASVQWGEEEDRLAAHSWAAGIEPLGCGFADVADLAAAIAGFDLLISIDSAPAHLAGALGVPVWTLLSDPCSWRWGLEVQTTPLYRSMRLIRQPVPQDWSSVTETVCHLLEEDARAASVVRPGGACAPSRSSSSAPADPVGKGARPDSFGEALRMCCEDRDLRAIFVADPLGSLASLGVPLSARDHAGLAELFRAMVDCHGGFSWCTPLGSVRTGAGALSRQQ